MKPSQKADTKLPLHKKKNQNALVWKTVAFGQPQKVYKISPRAWSLKGNGLLKHTMSSPRTCPLSARYYKHRPDIGRVLSPFWHVYRECTYNPYGLRIRTSETKISSHWLHDPHWMRWQSSTHPMVVRLSTWRRLRCSDLVWAPSQLLVGATYFFGSESHDIAMHMIYLIFLSLVVSSGTFYTLDYYI